MTGLSYGIAADDIAGDMAAFLLVGAVQLPAIWCRGSPPSRRACWSHSWRFTFLGLWPSSPHWLLDLVPFTHTQHVPGAHIRTAPVMWRLLLDAALIAIGLAAFRHRDLR